MTGLYRLMLVAAAALTGAAPVRADAPGSGEVTAVSLAPAAGKTEIVVAVRGAVDVRDFLLASPDRLVLDVVGATLGGTPAALYDGVKRGGVLNLRYSQFRPDVVRIVVELEAPADLHGRPLRRGHPGELRLGPAVPGLVVHRRECPGARRWPMPPTRRRSGRSAPRCPPGSST